MQNVYEKLLTLDKRYLSGYELARVLNINTKSRKVVLSRLVKRKVLRRIRRNIYELILKPSDVLEVANIMYQPSYLSYTYCLGKLGVIDQIAYEIEFATTKKTKHMEIKDRSVVFRKMKKELYFGYSLKNNVFIAEPEKAFLDTLYLKSKGLASLDGVELNLGELSKRKLLKMSKKFPECVQREVEKIFDARC